MSLAREYGRQARWRDWPRVLDLLPPLAGAVVLDLGCGPGHQAAALAARGARVIAIDANDDLLAAALARAPSGVEFRHGDLRSLDGVDEVADGIWCSFTAAYFPDFAPVLAVWARRLRPGGWIALTEIDDLFGHEPLAARARDVLDDYVRDALDADRYDFRMGRKLRGHLEAAGFTVAQEIDVPDAELSFDGPARAEVAAAWRRRFDRLRLLRDYCGDGFEPLRDEFLACLARPDHRSTARVVAVRGRS